MTYRPRIPDETNKRVEKHVIGDRVRPNAVYKESVEFLYTEEGEKREWLQILEKHSEETDQDINDVLNNICRNVFDESGEVEIQFKEKLGLD